MGMIGFARALAGEIGRYNITVNTICPGNPGGERNVEVARDLAEHLGTPFKAEEFREVLKENRKRGVLGGRFLAEEGYTSGMITHMDVAAMVLFLASDEACNITGQDINVTAGSVLW
jgi:NAD(P)-dependent dehydrogenase (short-subunit alcohol dehydrogenase family)